MAGPSSESADHRRNRARAVRLVLGSAVALGVFVLAYYLLSEPGAVGLDYRVYHVAGEAVIAGENPYAVTPADSPFHFVYPPVTALLFVPSALVGGWLPGYLVLTALSLGVSGAATIMVVRYVESLGYAVGRVERALVFGFLVTSSHSAPSLVYGQVNHLLVAALVAGLAWLAREREWRAGAALAVPAFVKVFPGAVGLWLLRRRAWRAIAAAVGTAVALTAAGLAVFGVDTYRSYVVDAVLVQRESEAFAGGLDPTAGIVSLRRPLSVAFPSVDPAWYAIGAAALLAPVLAALYRRPRNRTDRHLAVFGTLAAMLLAFPSLLVYYVFLAFPLVVLLYDFPAGRGRTLFVAGATLANLSVSMHGVGNLLRALPLSPATADAIRDVVEPVFTVGTPVLYGCLLMLAGCVYYRLADGAVGAPLVGRVGSE